MKAALMIAVIYSSGKGDEMMQTSVRTSAITEEESLWGEEKLVVSENLSSSRRAWSWQLLESQQQIWPGVLRTWLDVFIKPFIESSQQTSSLVCEIAAIFSELQTLWGVRIPNPEEVQDYLLRFPDMIDIVSRVVRIAREHLPESDLSLEVYHDPEVEDRYLVLYARAREYDEAFMDRIEEAEKSFINLLTHKEGWLQLTTDFREVKSA